VRDVAPKNKHTSKQTSSRRRGKWQAHLHAFLTQVLSWDEWSATFPGCFVLRKSLRYPLRRGLCPHQSRSGRRGEDNSFLWPQLNPNFSVFQPVAQHDSDIFKRCLEPTRYKVTGSWIHNEENNVDSLLTDSPISTIVQRTAHRYETRGHVTYELITTYFCSRHQTYWRGTYNVQYCSFTYKSIHTETIVFQKRFWVQKVSTEMAEGLPWSCHCAPLFLRNTARLCGLVGHYGERRRAITSYQDLAQYVNP